MSDSFAHRFDHEITSRERGPSADAAAEPQRRTATRADLLEGVSSTCPNLSRSETRDVLEMALAEVSDALVRGEAVKLRSFGLFAVREKRERIGRNPRTGVEVPIKPRRVLTFKPSPVLLDLVNGTDAGVSTQAHCRDGAGRKKQ